MISTGHATYVKYTLPWQLVVKSDLIRKSDFGQTLDKTSCLFLHLLFYRMDFCKKLVVVPLKLRVMDLTNLAHGLYLIRCTRHLPFASYLCRSRACLDGGVGSTRQTLASKEKKEKCAPPTHYDVN